MFIQKAKGYHIKVKYQISNITLTMRDDCLKKKKSNVMIESGVKCKAPSYDYQVLWEVIYAYFYN